jgi:hypothetical protein
MMKWDSTAKSGILLRISLATSLLLLCVVVALSCYISSSLAQRQLAPAATPSEALHDSASTRTYNVCAGIFSDKAQADACISELKRLNVAPEACELSPGQWGVIVCQSADFTSASNVKSLLQVHQIDSFVIAQGREGAGAEPVEVIEDDVLAQGGADLKSFDAIEAENARVRKEIDGTKSGR